MKPANSNCKSVPKNNDPLNARQIKSLSCQSASGSHADLHLESLIREDFERCHPGETLEDLKRRASFSKEDKGLLRDWMAIAASRAAADQAKGPQLNSAA